MWNSIKYQAILRINGFNYVPERNAFDRMWAFKLFLKKTWWWELNILYCTMGVEVLLVDSRLLFLLQSEQIVCCWESDSIFRIKRVNVFSPYKFDNFTWIHTHTYIFDVNFFLWVQRWCTYLVIKTKIQKPWSELFFIHFSSGKEPEYILGIDIAYCSILASMCTCL